MNTREILLYLSLTNDGDWDKIYEFISHKEKLPPEEEILKSIKSFKGNYITILDNEYPLKLKQICKPPFLLYYKGDISLISKYEDILSVVGSRDCSEYGIKMTTDLVKELSKKLIIVSGLARGVDGLAHKAALSSNGKTVAVLGSGINMCYPQENQGLYDEIAQKGLILSEYPDRTMPSPNHFPTRNRIVAALTNNLLITEGKMNSGTSISAHIVAQNGGNVMCVPARAGENSLCNHLISSGAYLVENPDDVFYIMNKDVYSPIFESEK